METSLRSGEHILYKKHAARQVEGDEEDLMLVREEVLGSPGNPDSPPVVPNPLVTRFSALTGARCNLHASTVDQLGEPICQLATSRHHC